MGVTRLANSEHAYVYEEQNDVHQGQCQNGVCTATASHDIVGPWKGDGDASHTRICSVAGCAIPETEDHDYGAWLLVEPATNTKAGEEQRTCGVCSHVQNRVIPMLHDLPETGDAANLVLWSALLAMSFVGMMLVRKQREA